MRYVLPFIILPDVLSIKRRIFWKRIAISCQPKWFNWYEVVDLKWCDFCSSVRSQRRAIYVQLYRTRHLHQYHHRRHLPGSCNSSSNNSCQPQIVLAIIRQRTQRFTIHVVWHHSRVYNKPLHAHFGIHWWISCRKWWPVRRNLCAASNQMIFNRQNVSMQPKYWNSYVVLASWKRFGYDRMGSAIASHLPTFWSAIVS